MGYRPPSPLAAPLVQYVPIPEGDAGLAATLARIIAGIHAYNPLTDHLAEQFASDHPELTDTELAAEVYSWVKAHCVYVEEDFGVSDISDAIATPDALLADIARNGEFRGDCAHCSSLLGGIYTRLGFPVTMCWIKTFSPDKPFSEENHVYPIVSTDDGDYAADAIIPEWQFGDEVPREENLFRREIPV